MDLTAAEIRVLGCLLEKQRTTPEAYPLSLNALRLACNQSTNRDPVSDYDEPTIREALHRLSRRRWARLASGPGSRAPKYRHLLDETLRLPTDEVAVLCVLMLRGEQTPGELKQRSERLHPFSDLEAAQATIAGLIDRGLVARLPRRPGQKEERYAHRLSEDLDAASDAPVVSPAAPANAPLDREHVAAAPLASELATDVTPTAPPAADQRIARLEEEIADLRAQLSELRVSLEALRADLGA